MTSTAAVAAESAAECVPTPLQALGLTKSYGRTTAVWGLDLELEPGTVTGFLGPNGAGKSTALRMLVGLIRPTSGAALLFGRPAADPAGRRRLGYLPADPAFVAGLTGAENLALLADLRGCGGGVDRDRVADRIGLRAEDVHRPVRELSSGTVQKLGLVAALQHRPDLVLLDEPANRLDPLVHKQFCVLLRDLADEGRTVLLSSHVLAEVEAVCDRALVLREGHLVAGLDIAVSRLRAPRHVTVTYRGTPPIPPGLLNPVVHGNNVIGTVPAFRPDLLRQLLADDRVTDVQISPPSLEDLFLDLYGGGDGAAPDPR